MIWCWKFYRKNNYFVPYSVSVSCFIEDRYVFFNICSCNVLVSAGYGDMNPIEFYCDLLTLYSFHSFLDCWRLFSSVLRIHTLGIFITGKPRFQGLLIFRLLYRIHVVMLTVLVNDSNRSTSWWKSYSNFKLIILMKG